MDGVAAEIGREAFIACTSLKSLDLSNVTSIGEKAFSYCGTLETVVSLESITSLGKKRLRNADRW